MTDGQEREEVSDLRNQLVELQAEMLEQLNELARVKTDLNLKTLESEALRKDRDALTAEVERLDEGWRKARGHINSGVAAATELRQAFASRGSDKILPAFATLREWADRSER